MMLLEARKTQRRGVADDLRECARVIREHGWCQHVLRDSTGRLCAMGAIAITAGMTISANNQLMGIESGSTAAFRYRTMAMALAGYLTRHGLESAGQIPAWNDRTPGLSADDVAATFEKCAAEREESAAVASGSRPEFYLG